MSLTFVFWSSKAVAMPHNTLHAVIFSFIDLEIFPCLFLSTSVHECGHVLCYQTEVNTTVINASVAVTLLEQRPEKISGSED